MVGGYLYLWLDDEIRRQVEKRFADHYANLEVEVGRARFEKGRGIAIYDIRLLEPQPAGPARPILSVDELYLAGKLRIEDLVGNRLAIDEIRVRGATLQASRRGDGSWNARRLLPLPQLSEDLPVVRVEDATLVVTDAASGTTAPRTLQGIELTLTPVETTNRAAATAEKRFHAVGTATGLPAREMRVEGEVGISDADFNLTVNIIGLEVTPESIAVLPGLPGQMMRGADVSGRADVTFQVSRDAAGWPPSWSAAVRFDRGRMTHPSLPVPLSELSFTANADSARLRIERLACRCGPATVVLAGERTGWAVNAPLAVAARVTEFMLNDHWRMVLPETYADVWERFEPAGSVDAEIRLTYDGRRWRPQLMADCRDVSLTDVEEFPYRLQQTTGRVEYQPAQADAPDKLRLDLTGMGGGRPVRIEAELTHLGRSQPIGVAADTAVASEPANQRKHPLGWVEISGTDVPLHEQLVAALPEKAERLVRSLRPQGAIDFRFRADWEDLSQQRANVIHEVRLKDCAIHYERFPYPLRQVAGLVTQRDGIWTIQGVEGRGWNDSTVVVCRGESSPGGAGFQTDLTFQATNVALDDHLKLALPPGAQLAWEELQPQGRVDFTIRALCEPGQAEPLISMVLQPRERSVSIEPAKFPYRLEQIEGKATYHAGRVEFHNVMARHGRAVFSAVNGSWQPGPGGWQLQLAGVNVDRLTPHRDLFAALPARWQRTVERLQPGGTFGIYNSSVSFTKSATSASLAAAWDVHLDCHQASLRGEMPIESITGGIHLVGRHDGRTPYTAGDLALDALVWKDVQLTNVRGPLWMDPAQCLLGEAATRKQAQPIRRVTADAYGGSLTANAEIQYGGNPTYKLDLALGGANLARFANERLGGPSDMGGTVSGRLHLSGASQSTQSLQGTGVLNVVDANIYELPVLVAMLKVLKIRTPDTTAFNRCDMQFAIQGEHIHFEKLNLLGDAVNLYGKGDSHFDRRLDLVFFTIPEPANLPIPLWKSFAGQVSQHTLQLKVVGTWDNAEVQPQTLPGFNQVLEQIQAGAATMAPPSAARDTTLLSR